MLNVMDSARFFSRAAAMIVPLLVILSTSPLQARDLILDQQSGFVIPVQVNGQTLRLRVDTGANGVIVLNPDVVQRLGLVEAPMDRNMAITMGIGAPPRSGEIQSGIDGEVPMVDAPTTRTLAEHERIRPFVQLGSLMAQGKFAIARASIGGRAGNMVFAWFERSAVADADGLISPAELPYDNVTLRLAPERANERTVTLAGQYTRLSGFSVPMPVQGRNLHVKLSAVETNSIATAAAGSVLAQAHRGSWSGDLRRHNIALGVERPVRPMNLGRPFALGGRLRVSDFLVRVRDHGGNLPLPAARSEEIRTDPDEVVVVAPGANQPVRFLLVLGQDQLSSCSSVTYRRRSVSLVMRCS